MVDAPERLYADRGPRGGWMYRAERMPDTVAEHVRADLIARLQEQVETLTRSRDGYAKDSAARAIESDRWKLEAHTQMKRSEAAEAERDRLREAGNVVLASWDERMPDGPEQYKTSDDLGFSYWSPSASMVSSEAMSVLRAALQKEPQP